MGGGSRRASHTLYSAAGQGLYEVNCESCHGADARSGSANENLAGEVEEELGEYADVVLSGKGNGEMPAFDTLTDQEIADILAYIATL